MGKLGKKLKRLTAAAAVSLMAVTPALADEFNTHARADKPRTEHSQYIADLQARYGNLPGHLKTAIVDTDQIRRDMALNDEDPEDLFAGEDHLVTQAHEQTGQTLDSAMSVYIYQTLAKDHPEAFQMRLDDLVGRFDTDTAMCVVTTMSPDHTNRSANRYIYFQHPAVYGELSTRDPGTAFTSAHIRRYTDYHEIAHCLDERHERRLMNGDAVNHSEGLYTQHKSDAFADVLAGLLMARDGARDAPGRRAVMRTVNSRMVGPYLARLGSRGFNDQYLQHAGAIYTVQRPLNAAQGWVNATPQAELAAMSTQALIDTAHDIVDTHALGRAEFNDISGYHADPGYLAWLAQQAAQDDDYKTRLDGLKAYIRTGEAVTKQVFGLGPEEDLPQMNTDITVTAMGPFQFADAQERAAMAAEAETAITTALGDTPASKENLANAYTRALDQLRARLDSTDGAQARHIRGVLTAMPDALRNLAHTPAPIQKSRNIHTTKPRAPRFG